MAYFTPTRPCQATLDIKKSEFIGHGYPIDSRDAAMQQLQVLKQQYPDARHHCWAYVIGDPSNTTSAGFDDDGEPSGTAGKPILHVLQHKGIGNCLIVVVRYFGGIKLGAGGLTRAYGGTAQAVVDAMIDAMVLQPFVAMDELTIQTDFANESYIRHIAASCQAEVVAIDYQQKVSLTLHLPAHNKAALIEKIGIYGQVLTQD